MLPDTVMEKRISHGLSGDVPQGQPTARISRMGNQSNNHDMQILYHHEMPYVNQSILYRLSKLEATFQEGCG